MWGGAVGAGVVDAIRDGVETWQVGDRVAASFVRDWIEGRSTRGATVLRILAEARRTACSPNVACCPPARWLRFQRICRRRWPRRSPEAIGLYEVWKAQGRSLRQRNLLCDMKVVEDGLFRRRNHGPAKSLKIVAAQGGPMTGTVNTQHDIINLTPALRGFACRLCTGR
jgi:hypothetical protein